MIDLSNFYEGVKYIQPEISASIFLVAIVLFDLIFDKNKKALPYLAITGIIVTGLFAIGQFGLSQTVFQTSETSKIGMVSVDPFGAFFKLLILTASLIVILFSIYSKEINSIKERQGEYYTLIFGMILGMLLMISASDFVLIYLSMELLSLSSYVLAGITKLRDRNSEASLKYVIYGAASSGLMLFGISIIYGLTGSTNLYDINCAIQNLNIDPVVFAFANILVLAGIGYKISAAPFHFWTPDVYEGAPVTITSYLSVASKAAGFAVLLRLIKTAFVIFLDNKGGWHLVPIFDWQTTLIVISVLTMTIGNLTALWQNNVKRMLAYSSIAHAGYMLLGVAALSNQGVVAVLIYFTFYMIMNLGAFLVVMIIADKTGKEDIHDYDGLGIKLPLLGVPMVIFLIALVGLPPTSGFIGKVYLFIALIDGNMVVPAIIAVVNSVISLYYYIRIAKHMFFNKPAEDAEVDFALSMGYKVLLLLLAVPTLLLGIYFTPVGNLVKNSIQIFGL